MIPIPFTRSLAAFVAGAALAACATSTPGTSDTGAPRTSATTSATTATDTTSTSSSAAATSSSATASGAATSTTSSSGATAASAWRPLIDDSLSAWRGYKASGIPSGWRVESGVLMKTEAINDLVSKDEYDDFELEFDWKIGPKGNAGVFYRGTEEFAKIYYTAPEYQLLDDAGHADGRSRLTAAASGYALYPAPAGVVKPADQWNSSRIVVRGSRVEHWLNGQQVVTYDIGSPDWEAKVRASKFATWKKYGRIPRGRLGIQGDHTGVLALRGMRIRSL